MCIKHGFGVDRLWSSVAFEGPIKDLIHAFKYENQRALALELGPILLQSWPDSLPQPAILIPVPLSAQRLKERGYNQAALLAVQLSENTGVPYSAKHLKRTRHTAAQAYKSATDRRQNLQGAFAAPKQAFANSTVILVDDVCTTGATLEACAAACRTAGAQEVWATTVARAV